MQHTDMSLIDIGWILFDWGQATGQVGEVAKPHSHDLKPVAKYAKCRKAIHATPEKPTHVGCIYSH